VITAAAGLELRLQLRHHALYEVLAQAGNMRFQYLLNNALDDLFYPSSLGHADQLPFNTAKTASF
jgi:hypothetical protein